MDKIINTEEIYNVPEYIYLNHGGRGGVQFSDIYDEIKWGLNRVGQSDLLYRLVRDRGIGDDLDEATLIGAAIGAAKEAYEEVIEEAGYDPAYFPVVEIRVENKGVGLQDTIAEYTFKEKNEV